MVADVKGIFLYTPTKVNNTRGKYTHTHRDGNGFGIATGVKKDFPPGMPTRATRHSHNVPRPVDTRFQQATAMGVA